MSEKTPEPFIPPQPGQTPYGLAGAQMPVPNGGSITQYMPQVYSHGMLQFNGYPTQAGAYPAEQPGVYPQPPLGLYHQWAPPPPPPPPPASGTQAASTLPVYHTAMPLTSLTFKAAPIDCLVCKKRAMTSVEFQAGYNTRVWAFFFDLFLPCVPNLTTWTKDVKHSCGNCGMHLATWNQGVTVVYQHP